MIYNYNKELFSKNLLKFLIFVYNYINFLNLYQNE